MVYRGHVQNGVVVFDQPVPIADGTQVEVEVVDPAKPRRTLAERLSGVIGIVNDLPPDMSEQHDHYIHGTPKR